MRIHAVEGVRIDVGLLAHSFINWLNLLAPVPKLVLVTITPSVVVETEPGQTGFAATRVTSVRYKTVEILIAGEPPNEAERDAWLGGAFLDTIAHEWCHALESTRGDTFSEEDADAFASRVTELYRYIKWAAPLTPTSHVHRPARHLKD